MTQQFVSRTWAAASGSNYISGRLRMFVTDCVLISSSVRRCEMRDSRYLQDPRRRRVLRLRRRLDLRSGQHRRRMPRCVGLFLFTPWCGYDRGLTFFVRFSFIDIDECDLAQGLLSRCGEGAICSNTPGSFSCSCPPGFSGDPSTRCLGTIGNYSSYFPYLPYISLLSIYQRNSTRSVI